VKRRNEKKMLQALQNIHDPEWRQGDKYQFELHGEDGYYWIDLPQSGFQPRLDVTVTMEHRCLLAEIRRLLTRITVVLDAIA
jgi:hypothetical protein